MKRQSISEVTLIHSFNKHFLYQVLGWLLDLQRRMKWPQPHTVADNPGYTSESLGIQFLKYTVIKYGCLGPHSRDFNVIGRGYDLVLGLYSSPDSNEQGGETLGARDT